MPHNVVFTSVKREMNYVSVLMGYLEACLGHLVEKRKKNPQISTVQLK